MIFAAQLLERYAEMYPLLPDSLQKLLDPPPRAAEEVLRQAFAERRQLYSSRTGEQFPRPVRLQNETLLHRLEALEPDLEAHIVAIRAWRLLAEAAASIEQFHPGRARHRLDAAAALLAGRPADQPLVGWLSDLECDLRQPPPPPPPPVVPHICSPPVATVRAGDAVDFRIASEPPADAYQADGLPAGLTLEPASGRIAGTVAQAGHHVVNLSATLAGEVGHGTLVLTVEAPPPPPLLLVPSEVTAIAGQPFECAYVVWPAGTAVLANGLPAGLELDAARHCLCGVPAAAGTAQVELAAAGPGGNTRTVIALRISEPVTTAPAPAVLPPPPAPSPTRADRFTLRLANGRRVHVFGIPRVRLGRTANSDLRITACAHGDPAATRSLSGEISRQHAEIFLEAGEVRVCDGWRNEGSPSTFGTFLDSARVGQAPGSVLQDDQILRLTARALGPTVPHWRVRVLTPADSTGVPATITGAAAAGANGVWLERLDALTDDILLMRWACNLATLGLTRDPAWLWRTDEGFLVVAPGNAPSPLETVTQIVTGSTLDALGSVHPHDLREALELAAKV
ncbi:MAG TPA: putative Ig domain-containing protein [Opitutaceae bacterium]